MTCYHFSDYHLHFYSAQHNFAVLGILKKVSIKNRPSTLEMQCFAVPVAFQESWSKCQARKGCLEASAEMSEGADQWSERTKDVQQP